jgi:U3 small nucleolar RNA-associated protein 3
VGLTLCVLREHTLTGARIHPVLLYDQPVHASRDRILLDGDEMQYDEDDFGVEDEVFALNGVDLSSEDEDVDEDQEGEEDAMEVDESPSTPHSTKGPKGKPTKTRKPPSKPASDSGEGEGESEEEETWGTKKSAYYSANDAHFDSEDEEANELEEKEARRLQMKAREGMCDEDFGLDNLQALVEDGRVESDVIECVFFCSAMRLEALIVIHPQVPRGRFCGCSIASPG